jgi:hypothetical protein
LVVGAGVLIAVLAACVGTTAVAFGRAPLADRVLVTALDRLSEFRRAQATIFFDGEVVHASCVDRLRSTTVAVDDTLVRERGRHLVGHTTREQQTEFDLAGCPNVLHLHLLLDLARHAKIDARPVAGGTVLTFPHAHPELAVVVTSRGLPSVLRLQGLRMRGSSRLHFGEPA